MIYLDNAATSKFKPKEVSIAMMNTINNSANFSRSSHNEAIELATKIEKIRDYIKTTLNATKEHELVFTPSCSDGLNQIILGLLLNQDKDSHVITTIYEHNSVLRPLFELEKQGYITLTILKPNKYNQITAEDVEQNLRVNTKLIVTNHVSNVTGYTINIEKIGKIAKKYSVPYLVDCAQSIGHLPINLNYIDFISAPAHKGLHGPQGIGFMIVNKNYKLKHTRFGGSGINSESTSQPDIYPEGYEVGTINSPGIIGMNEGFKFTYDSFNKIQGRINNLSYLLYALLSKLDGLNIFSVKGSSCISIAYKNLPSNELSAYLNKNNIASRPGLHCAPLVHKYLKTLDTGLTRLSIGLNNSEKDIEYVYNVLAKLNHIN